MDKFLHMGKSCPLQPGRSCGSIIPIVASTKASEDGSDSAGHSQSNYADSKEEVELQEHELSVGEEKSRENIDRKSTIISLSLKGVSTRMLDRLPTYRLPTYQYPPLLPRQ